jgi:cellulose biosynthesis protein BcsQ
VHSTWVFHMVVTVGGIKGGTGKTTVATHLTAIAAGQKADVLLVDADDQETAADFTARAKRITPTRRASRARS